MTLCNEYKFACLTQEKQKYSTAEWVLYSISSGNVSCTLFSKGLKLSPSPPKSRRSVDASNDMKTRRNDNTVSVGLSFQRVSPLLRRGISHDANPGKPLGNQSDRLDFRRSSGHVFSG